MVSVATDKALLENESEIWPTAMKVVLEGEAKWTFSDGRRPFMAPVLDPTFLERVNARGSAKVTGSWCVSRQNSFSVGRVYEPNTRSPRSSGTSGFKLRAKAPSYD